MELDSSIFERVAPRLVAFGRLAAIFGELMLRAPALAVAAPDRQRWALTELYARARALEAEAPAARWSRAAVCCLRSALGHLGATWWSGYIPALERRARPGRALGRCDPAPTSWREVAARARALAEAAPSWADEPAPRSRASSERFDDVALRLERLAGPIASARLPDDAPARCKEQLAALRRIAVELRLLRGAVEPFPWGAAIGRVRRIADVLGDAELTQRLDPSVAPACWSTLLGDEPPRERPAAAPASAATIDSTCPLIPMIEDAAARRDAEVLRARAAPEAHSRGRARTRRRGQSRARERRRSDEALIGALRPRVAGIKALLVTNRPAPDVQQALERRLALCCEVEGCEPRRVQAAAQRISAGRYPLVMVAKSFVSHDTTNALRRACRSAGVRYLDVGKGRFGVIVRRLAQAFEVDGA